MSIIRLSHMPVTHRDHPAGVYTTRDDGATLGPAPLPDVADFLAAEENGKAAFKSMPRRSARTR